MQIQIQIGCDTFAEAEKVFRQLGMLDGGSGVREAKPAPTSAPTIAAPTIAAPTIAAPVQEPAKTEAPAAAPAFEVTVDHVKDAMRAYMGRPGCTALTGRNILLHHGIQSGRVTDAKTEQFAVLKRAFETAGPDAPLGEAA